MITTPPKRMGLIAGAVVGATIVGIQVLVAGNVFRQSVGLGQFATMVLLALTLPAITFWLIAFHELATLSYHLDRNALTVSRGLVRHTYPIAMIETVTMGHEIATDPALHGLAWPGYYRGRIELAGFEYEAHCTEPLHRQVLISGQGFAVSLSPPDLESFCNELEAMRKLGALHQVEPGSERIGLPDWGVWTDRAFLGALAGALLLNVALYGLVMGRYDALPVRLSLHYDANGLVDRIALKQWLFAVPVIGSGVLAINALLGLVLHRGARTASILLGGIAAGVQLLSWVAALQLVF